MQLGGVAAQHGQVDGPQQSRVGSQRDRAAGQADESVGQLLDGEVAPRAHVVDLPGLALGHQEAVGAHDVAHVREVAAGREVADRDAPLTVALGPGDPGGEGGRHEAFGLPWPEVVERARQHHLETMAEEGLLGEGLRRRFAGGVRAGGSER